MSDGLQTAARNPASNDIAVSVIMANYNGAEFLSAAIQSVLRQSLAALELILIDDGSTDTSIAIMTAAAARDLRVKLHRTASNSGPAGARNLALDHAAGKWIAVVDSDDLLHPRRFEWLVAAAEQDQADIAADDAMLFEQNGAFAPSAMLNRDAPEWIAAADYIRSNALFRRGVALGYLKPIIRSAILAGGIRYNGALRIAEDYDLIARLLVGGARMRTYPQLSYFYRKHANSISHRLSAAPLQAMLDADAAMRTSSLPGAVVAALDDRRRSLEDALSFTALIAALKQRQPARALRIAVARPAAAGLLRTPVLDRLRRLVSRPAPLARRDMDVCLLTRQRVIGNTNGSSAYLINLCETVVRQGARLHLVCPSPVMFGRWPFLLLRPEMSVFASMRIRGGIRFGRLVLARNPRVFWAAGLTVANRLAKRLRLTRADWVKPAPYAIGAPWTRADYLYIARYARPHADCMLADYAFQTEGFPYVLRPDSPTMVIMHDLFSARTSQFQQTGDCDSVTPLTVAEEMALLAQADAVIAIQAEEAELIRPLLPAQQVLTVPMACTPEAAPAPGAGLDVLFVGSGTAPNVVGMRWFIEQVWPAVLLEVPQAALVVVGGISHAVDRRTPGIRVLGQVPSLATVYRQASVVISPLLAGSGLKIKLVEALSHGKAVVATPATLQGFGHNAGAVVMTAETPAAFAAGVVTFLRDPALRAARGQAGIELATRLFSPATCHTPLIEFLQRALHQPQAMAAKLAAE